MKPLAALAVLTYYAITTSHMPESPELRAQREWRRRRNRLRRQARQESRKP